MIKQFSNLTDSPKVLVESKFLPNQYETDLNELEITSASSDTMFVKLTLTELENIDKITGGYLYVYLQSDAEYIPIEIYQCNVNNFDFDTLRSINSSIRENQKLITKLNLELPENYEDLEDDLRAAALDITQVVENLGNEVPVVLAVKFPNIEHQNESLIVHSYESLESETKVCKINYRDLKQIENLCEHDTFDLGDKGKLSTNLFTGTPIYSLPIISTASKLSPISLAFLHNNNYLDPQITYLNGFVPDYAYQFNKKKVNRYEVVDSSGLLKEYKVKSPSEVGVIEEENFGALFYCQLDGSYFYEEYKSVVIPTNMPEIIKLYDKSNFCYTFNLYDEKYLLKEVKTPLKHSVVYNWVGNQLNSIANSDSEKIVFTYDSNDQLIRVSCDAIKQYVTFTRTLTNTGQSVNVKKYSANNDNSGAYTIINDFTVHFNINNHFHKIIDNISHEYFIASHANGGTKIHSIQNKNSEDISFYEYEYTYEENRTIVRDIDGNKTYYYFDDYGRIKSIVNPKSGILSYNYAKVEDGETQNISSAAQIPVQTKNYLRDSSFEEDTLSLNSGPGWIRNQTYSNVYINQGIYTGKYLYMQTIGGEDVIIQQQLYDVIPGDYVISGRVLHSSGLKNDELMVLLEGTYDVAEEVMIQVDTDTVEYEYQTVTYQFSRQADINLGVSGWHQFTSNPITIPEEAVNINMNVKLIVSNAYAEIGFDELYVLGPSKEYTNLIKNGYMQFYNSSNELTNWSVPYGQSTALLEKSFVDDSVMQFFGNNVMKITGTNQYDSSEDKYKCKEIYQHIFKGGCCLDKFVFNVIAKGYVPQGEEFQANISFDYDNLDRKTYEFDFDKCYDEWQALSRTIIAEDNYSAISVCIKYSGSSDVYIDCLQLFKGESGKIYNYDQRNNVIESLNGNGLSTKKFFNSENKIEELYSKDGSYFKYKYVNNLLKKVTDLHGNTVEFQYDTKNRMSGQTITAEGVTLNSSIEYDDVNNKETYTDEFGYQTILNLDYLKRVANSVNQSNLSTDYKYNNKLELERIQTKLENVTYRNTFDYSETGINTEIVSYGGANYNFEYDSFNRIKRIKFNNELIEEYDYDNKNPAAEVILEKRIVDNNSCYEFDYDDKGLLITIQLNGVIIAEYDYNQSNLLSVIYDSLNNVDYHYEYDSTGRLIREYVEEGNTKTYKYDNLGNIQKCSYNIDGKLSSVDYEYPYETNEYTKVGYLRRLSEAFYDDIIIGGQPQYGNKITIDSNLVVRDSSINLDLIKFTNTNQNIEYSLSKINTKRCKYSEDDMNYEKWKKKRFRYNKTFYAWVRPTSNTCNKTNICSFEKILNVLPFSSYLGISDTGKLIYYSKINSPYKSTNGQLKLNEWNLIGISFINDRTKIFNKTKAVLFLNDEITSEFEIDENVRDFVEIILNNQNNIYANDVELNTKLDFAMISIGAHNYSRKDILAIYNEGQKYLFGNKCPAHLGASYYDKFVYDGFDVITLAGSLESVKGIKPIKINFADHSYRFDKTRIFKYDQTLNRHVFGSYSNANNLAGNSNCGVAYKLPLQSIGTIALRFKYEENNGDKAIFSFKKGQHESLSVIISTGNLIKLIVNNDRISVDTIVTPNIWHKLAVTYSLNRLIIYLDGTIIYSENKIIDLLDNILYLGNDELNDKPLNGCLEMFAFKDSYTEHLNQIISNGGPISVRKEIDTLGRVKNNTITVNDREFVTTYSYDKTRINGETLFDGTVIEYKYDESGNIVEKTTTKEGISSTENYSYNKLGRLETVTYGDGDCYYYIYSKDGNLLSISSGNKSNPTLVKSFIYNGSRLVQVMDVTQNPSLQYINYQCSPTAMSFYPQNLYIKGVNYILSWQGKRLVGVGDDIIYTYNHQGIRTKKETANDITTFELEGTNILSMTKETAEGTYRLDFTYDAQNQLIGLTTVEGSYFYVKDATNNILGLIDTNGDYVVKYKYDVWGNILEKNIITSCIAANHNPFMYKGYYYDDETGLFMVGHRYYNPEWGRWLSPDDIEYLDPQSINGLNLYAYCNNDPVMYSDGSGHFPILAVLIGAGIGFLTSYIPDVISEMQDGFDWSDFNTFEDNWVKYVGATLGGAIGGLGAGLGTTILTNGVGNVVEAAFAGDISNFGDVMIQFALGGVLGGVGYGASKGIASIFADKKIFGILGNLSDNAKVNKRLAKAGFGNLKIGKHGLATVYEKMYKKLGFETLEKGLSYGYDTIVGFIF